MVVGKEGKEKCSAILREDTHSDVLRRWFDEFTKVDISADVERVEREELLIRGDVIRVGSGRWVSEVHGILLHDTREPRDDSSEQVDSALLLP